jgi:hypothetical protein
VAKRDVTCRAAHGLDISNSRAQPTPQSLRPTRLREELTERVAQDFTDLATALRARGNHPHTVAHFLDRLLFAMFAEDAGILPKYLIDRLSNATKGDATAFSAALHDLFGKIAKGGDPTSGPNPTCAPECPRFGRAWPRRS